MGTRRGSGSNFLQALASCEYACIVTVNASACTRRQRELGALRLNCRRGWSHVHAEVRDTMRTVGELFNAPPRAAMAPDFVLARARDLEVAAARSRAHRQAVNPDSMEAAAHTTELRDRVRDALGIDRLPKASRVTYVDTIVRPEYTIHKIVFETIPDLPVPALLYLPQKKGPHPAVVHAPGHWMEDAKLAESLQILNQHLARLGIATLCFDPIGQGERRVGWHQHGQLAPLLVGFTTLGAMVAENIGALEILLDRDDIDAERIGMIGASGGGFTTLFAAALDTRISTAVVSSIVNSHVGQIRDAAYGTGWDGWVDLCNQVPGICAVGNLGDVLGLIAPRKLLIANAVDDPPFPLAGAREVAREVEQTYEYRNARDAFDFVEVPGTHGFQPHMRKVVSEFLRDRLLNESVDTIHEIAQPEFNPQWAVPHNVATAERPQSTHPVESGGTCLSGPVDTNGPLVAICRTEAIRLRQTRTPLSERTLHECIGKFPARAPLCTRVHNHVVLPEFEAQRLSFQPEAGITLDVMATLPRNWTDDIAPVFILLDEGGKQIAFDSPERRMATSRRWATVTPDLRGTGESAMSEFEVSTASWMIDRDMLNQRVWDVIRLVDVLSDRYSSSQQIDKSRIAVWGRGSFGLVALCAAAMDPRIAAAGTDDADSLESLLTVNSRRSPMLYHYKLLRTLDIDDLRAHIAPRPTFIGGPAAVTGLLECLEGSPGTQSARSTNLT